MGRRGGWRNSDALHTVSTRIPEKLDHHVPRCTRDMPGRDVHQSTCRVPLCFCTVDGILHGEQFLIPCALIHEKIYASSCTLTPVRVRLLSSVKLGIRARLSCAGGNPRETSGVEIFGTPRFSGRGTIGTTGTGEAQRLPKRRDCREHVHVTTVARRAQR